MWHCSHFKCIINKYPASQGTGFLCKVWNPQPGFYLWLSCSSTFVQSCGDLSLWMSSASVFVGCATSFCSSVFSVSKGPCSWLGDWGRGLWSIFSRSSQWLTELVSLNASELLKDLLKIFWPVKCLTNTVPMKAANTKCGMHNLRFKESIWILQLQRNGFYLGANLCSKQTYFLAVTDRYARQ